MAIAREMCGYLAITNLSSESAPAAMATRIPIQIAMKPTDPLSFWGVYAESGAAWIVGTRINSTADLVGGYLGKI
jgi:hypothetical protein